MTVYLGSEDTVTKEVGMKLVNFCCSDRNVEIMPIGIRTYGNNALKNIPQLVKLGNISPVVAVYDSDSECVVDLLKRTSGGVWKSTYSAISIAVDEAEAWLLADRKGFAKYFKVQEVLIPTCLPQESEICKSIPDKVSSYILREIVPHTQDRKIKEALCGSYTSKKPPLYNDVMVPFIRTQWNPVEAAKNSDSLTRAIKRVRKIFEIL